MRNPYARGFVLAAGFLLFSTCVDVRLAVAQTPCETAYEHANRIYYAHWIQWQALMERAGSPELQVFHDVVRYAREARTCVSPSEIDRIRRMYSREIYGLIALGRYEEAFDAFDAFFHDLPPDSVWTPFMYQFRAQVDTWTGHLALAAAHQAAAIRSATRYSMAHRAELYCELGRIYQRMQDFDNALTYARTATWLIGQEREQSAFRTLIEARALHLTSDIILERSIHEPAWRDSLEQAIRIVDRALSLYEQIEPSRNWSGALILRGSLAHIMDDAETALAYISRAEQVARGIEDKGMLVLAAVNRSNVLADQARWHEAERLLLAALRLVEGERMDVDHRRRVLIGLGNIYERTDRLTEAEQIYHDLIDVVEQLRSQLGTTDWSLSAFSRWQRSAYRGLVRVLLRQGRYQKAFLTLEHSRARYASDLLSAHTALVHLSSEQRERYERVTEDLATIRTKLLHEPYGTDAYIRLMDEETRLVAERAAMMTDSDREASLTLDAIQRKLAERNQSLLSYFIAWQDQEAMSHVFLVTPDTLLAIPLPNASRDEIEAAIQSISGVLSASSNDLRLADRQFSLRALHDLYVRLFEPVERHLVDGTRLVIVPSGPLYGLPFGALVEENVSRSTYRTPPYLIRRFPISYEPGAALLIAERTPRHKRSADVVAFGRARYAADSLLTSALPPFIRGGLSAEPDLPAVRAEVKSVTELFWKSRALLDEEATERAFYESMTAPSVLHIASHVLVDESTPLMSAILLSNSPTESDDGIIYLHELMGRPLFADLVVLSGCNTARGVHRSGEGSLGLHYGFRAMGAASSVSTLWLADDNASAKLMRDFYLGLREGRPKDVALQQAQLTYLAEAEKNVLSPFFWAAPVLYGDPAPISLQGRYAGLPAHAWYGLVAFGAVTALLALCLHHRRDKTRASS